MVRKLHIGGKIAAPGWEVFNSVPASYVDHIGNAKDLSRFPDCSFDLIYASHILEHFDYKDELLSVLTEWNRVMKRAGLLYISVPDIDVLAALLLDKHRFSTEERYQVMRMIFGGHLDSYDYHFAGLNFDFLEQYLAAAGFVNICKVDKFEFFEDSSLFTWQGEPVSLNVTAEK
jgi:predicted SAM-dependent methyltransferase